ncbi:hypothetical protein ACIBQ6_48585 [Nonomuraea sp. NPDC049655]|uniref:hypothetical protein n=1 Tax=Nonomuraea sp. NPDC049655 TaxID=3364355 RepID=UPI00379B7D5D
MRLQAKTWKLVAGTVIGAAAGIPLGLLLSAFLTWRHVLAGIVVAVACLIAATLLVPTKQKRAAADVLKEAKRFPAETDVEVEGSDTVLVISRRWSLWGPLTVVMKSSDKEWDEAFDEIAQGPGISTVPVTSYMIFRWGAVQLTDTITVMSSRTRLPRTDQKQATRWSRYRRQAREEWFQAKTGQ